MFWHGHAPLEVQARMAPDMTGSFGRAAAEIPCPLCQCVEHKILCERGKFSSRVTNVVCLSCGFVFQNPPLTAAEITGLYRSSHYVKRNYSEDIARTFHDMGKASPRRIAYLEQYVKLSSGPRALDVGAGSGAFLHALHEHGCDVLGVEADPEACEFIRRDLGLPLRDGMFEDLEFTGDSFDIVTLVAVFEHVAKPQIVLDKVASLLTPGGLLFIEVPNVLRMYTDEARWFDYFDPGHLYSFSPASLRRMLAQNGFEVIDVCESNPIGYFQSLWAVARPAGLTEPNGASFDFDAPAAVQRVVRYTRLVHPIRWLRDHKTMVLKGALTMMIGEGQIERLVRYSKSKLTGARHPS